MSRQARPPAYTAIQEGIGQRMAWVRALVEPNQTEAAKLLGIDKSTLNKIEAGTRAPSVFNVLAFANRFRVSTDFLLRGLLVAKTDHELALQLAALHPELVLPPDYTARDTGTGPAAGTDQKPKRPSPRAA